MSRPYIFADSGKLLARVIHAVQRGEHVTFLFGSALTAPGSRPEELGVPDAATLIEKVVENFQSTEEQESLDRLLEQSDHASRYQETMKFVIDCRGQDVLNELIQSSVLKARIKPAIPNQNFEQLELDTEGWYLRAAVEAAGQLIIENPSIFSSPILTTNFDPLLEVSLRKAGANVASIFLPADGQFTNVLAPGTPMIVHLHGFWRGSDTLHTPNQLTRNRPQLKGSLRSLLRETTLVVMGYGGWSDVFTRTLVDVISEQTEQLNVLWTFYSDNDDDIVNRNDMILSQFEALAGQRVVFYKGVDCHVFLPTLREKLRKHEKKTQNVDSVIKLQDEFIPTAFDLSVGGDHPPQAAFWVGREEELRIMLSTQSKVIAITGLGGNGKSTLAAKYLELKQSAEEITVSYWADCREQSNTLHTQLVRMVERVSQGKIKGQQLQDSNPQGIIDTLLDLLEDTKAILVFDNIDQYVDVEQCKAVATMDILFEEALKRKHSAQFLFTTRPKLDYLHSDFLQVQLNGLTIDETRRLFDICGVRLEATKAIELITEIHTLTSGHSLMMNLIATQVAKNKVNLDELILKLREGVEAGIENPLFTEIWTSLNSKQQIILRYLAEQIHPDPEQRIASYLGNALNYNQFSRAIKTLKALNLVVIKSPGNDLPDTLELHPLVRDFIRRRFPKEERAPYIDAIIHFYNGMIGKFRTVILSAPYSVLENWTGKVELCLIRGHYEEALEALSEVRLSLHKNGYPEEFIRLAVEVLDRLTPAKNENLQQQLDKIYEDLIETLAQLGRFEEADLWLSRFEKTLIGKTARYVLFCNARAYRYWYESNFSSAIEWAQRGVDLKTSGNIDTKYDCAHTLALAQRDSRDAIAGAAALKYFLQGEKLETILKPSEFDKRRGGPFYGNIGRCLQFAGDLDSALICIKQSAKILESTNDGDVLLNLGYAAFWIGEIFEAKQEHEIAYIAFRRAISKWKISSPPRARSAIDAANRVREKIPLSTVVPMNDWECDRAFLGWLHKC